MQWQNPDVHARSGEMRELMLKEFSYLPAKSEAYLKCFDKVAAEIKTKWPQHSQCLDKMAARKLVKDRDLCDVYPSGLLAHIYIDYVLTNGDLEQHFIETLSDMGLTCLQGDSHRLFASYVAIIRDNIK